MLRVARAAYDSMVAHAEAGAPQEVCGVLAGRANGDGRMDGERRDDDGKRRDDGERDDDGKRRDDDSGRVEGERRVEDSRQVPNVAAHPRTEYRMAPEAQLAAIDAVEDRGLDVVGFYHSHPAGPTGPSPTDEARATWPGYVYAIVSLESEEPELGAWEWTGEGFERLAVAVEG